MKKDNIDNLFDQLQGSFDTEEPTQGHQQRFLEKLNAGNKTIQLPKKQGYKFKYLSIAASVLLLCSLGFIYFNTNSSLNNQVVEISPEISNTEFYFANLIEQEITKLQNESSPETKKIIADTMAQLSKLEANYKGLENDLKNGGNSKLILSAMITNFQTRIDLLEDVLSQIEEIKLIKNSTDENSII